jgi:hypothetical protein
MTNIYANQMMLNCNYNFYEWYYKLHCFYIKNKRLDNSITPYDYEALNEKCIDRSLKIKYLLYKNEESNKFSWRLGYHNNKNW